MSRASPPVGQLHAALAAREAAALMATGVQLHLASILELEGTLSAEGATLENGDLVKGFL